MRLNRFIRTHWAWLYGAEAAEREDLVIWSKLLRENEGERERLCSLSPWLYSANLAIHVPIVFCAESKLMSPEPGSSCLWISNWRRVC